MARLLLGPQATSCGIADSYSIVTELSQGMPEPGKPMGDGSIYPAVYAMGKVKLPFLPQRLWQDPWPNDQYSILHNALHFPSLGRREQEMINGLVAAANMKCKEISPHAEAQYETAVLEDGEFILYRTFDKHLDVPCLHLIFDEEEDAAMAFPEKRLDLSLIMFLPGWCRALVRISEGRVLRPKVVHRYEQRSVFSPVTENGINPSGYHFMPTTRKRYMDELRDCLEGRLRMTTGAGTTFYATAEDEIFSSKNIAQMNSARNGFTSKITTLWPTAATKCRGRQLHLGPKTAFPETFRTSMTPNSEMRRMEPGALAFGFSRDGAKLVEPEFDAPYEAHGTPARGWETISNTGKPFMLVGATPNRWLALMAAHATIKLSRRNDTFYFGNPTYANPMEGTANIIRGQMHVLVCMPVSYLAKDMEAVGVRHRSAPGLTGDMAEAVRTVPYLGHFLNDCLMTFKGKLKTSYKDLTDLRRVDKEDFLLSIHTPFSDWDYNRPTHYRPSRSHFAPTHIMSPDGNDYLLTLNWNNQGNWPLFHTMLAPSMRSGLPAEMFGFAADPVVVQPVSRARTRILDL